LRFAAGRVGFRIVRAPARDERRGMCFLRVCCFKEQAKAGELVIEARASALVLIDLEQMIVGRELQPYSGKEVVARCARLAEGFREKGGMVVYVRVDLGNMLQLPVDQAMRDPKAPPPPASASELVPEAGYRAGDVLITKRQWGAFFGTDLEEQLRRRGVKTVVIGGIATNFGVESTARAAAGLGFATVFAEDAMSSMSADMHGFAVEKIFPRLGRVRSTEEILAGLRG
jgi:nicotinamidase-related amidase